MSNEIQIYQMNPLRGGAIGFTSGVKGGALTGAIGGALMMGFRAAPGEAAMIIVFTAVVGLTTGLMAGAIFGGALGVVVGGSCGLLRPSAAAGWVMPLWLVSAAALAVGLASLLFDSWQPLPLIGGALCGLLGGWVAGRDFWRISQQQHPHDPDA